MPFLAPLVPAIIGAGASIAGGAIANKGTQESAPTWDPAFSPLRDQILAAVRRRLASSADLSGYEGAGVANINRASNLTQQSLENSLTARGLNASPVAGAGLATLETGRGSAIAGFRNSLPLIQRTMQGEDLQQAGHILNLGAGIGTQTSSGGGVGGAVEQLAKYLGTKYSARLPGQQPMPGALGTPTAY